METKATLQINFEREMKFFSGFIMCISYEQQLLF